MPCSVTSLCTSAGSRVHAYFAEDHPSLGAAHHCARRIAVDTKPMVRPLAGQAMPSAAANCVHSRIANVFRDPDHAMPRSVPNERTVQRLTDLGKTRTNPAIAHQSIRQMRLMCRSFSRKYNAISEFDPFPDLFDSI